MSVRRNIAQLPVLLVSSPPSCITPMSDLNGRQQRQMDFQRRGYSIRHKYGAMFSLDTCLRRIAISRAACDRSNIRHVIYFASYVMIDLSLQNKTEFFSKFRQSTYIDLLPSQIYHEISIPRAFLATENVSMRIDRATIKKKKKRRL